jgi:hypothetical protein
MEALVKVVDHIPVINLRNHVTVSKVPFDIVTQGLRGKLRDAAQIPSGFGTRAGCLVVPDEGRAEILPAVDRAGGKEFKPFEHLAAHHHWEVHRHDVVVAVGGSDGDGVGARPSLGVGFAIKFLDADRRDGRGPLDGSQPVEEGGEAFEVVRRVVVIAARLMIAVVAVGA